MKKFFIILICALTTGCVGSLKNLKTDSNGQDVGYLILHEDFTFDGDKHDGCFIYFSGDKSPKNTKVSAKDEENTFRILTVPGGGKMYAEGINCIENKGLWAKARRKSFEPNLVLDVKPSTITYPGTIVGDWESEGFGVLDIINLGGGLVEDEGSLIMRREDRSNQVKNIIRKENPELLKKFKFLTIKFESNPNIIQ